MSQIRNKRARNGNTLRFDVADAAKASGYSHEHVRRLCRAGQIAHMRRRGPGRARYFFTAEQLSQFFALYPRTRRA